MVYMTNPVLRASLGPRDRQVFSPRYLARFFDFFLGATCGFGGVASKRRRTSSVRWPSCSSTSGFVFSFMPWEA